MTGNLRSERQGRARKLPIDGFLILLWKRIIQAREARLFDQSLRGHLDEDWGIRRLPEITDAEEYLLLKLQSNDAKSIASGLTKDPTLLPFAFEQHPLATTDQLPKALDLLLDLIELLHSDLVALPIRSEGAALPTGTDKAAGQEAFRNLVNPVLALYGPPLELLPIGHIVEQDAERRDLYVRPLPSDSERQLDEPVTAAKNLFLKRGATIDDKRAAVQALAGALEHLRPEARTGLLSKDEAALFEIANGFAIRHNNRGQKIDYDSEPWLDWMFHVYLATVHILVAVRDRPDRDGGNH